MKNGYKTTLKQLLLSYGLGTAGLIGTVVSSGSAITNYLKSEGFNVETGLDKPTYDYVVIGQSQATSANTAKAWRSIVTGGMLLVRKGNFWYRFVKKGI